MRYGLATTKTTTTSTATTASTSTIRSTAAGGRGQGRWKVSSRFFCAVVGRRRFRFRRDFFFFSNVPSIRIVRVDVAEL